MMLTFAGLMLNSCLDFDTTGDEFSQTQRNEKNVVRQGNVDRINYDTIISKKDFEAAMDAVQSNLGGAQAGVYALRGGKEGNPPSTHSYQYQFGLGVDQYAQYGVIPHVNFPYSGINLISSYAIDLKAYGGAYGAFVLAAKSMIPLLNMEEVDKLPEIKAAFLLLYDYAAIEAADIYGPLPYQDLKTNKQERPFTYDAMQTIYETTITNIDSIVKCFKHFDTREDWYKTAVLSALNKRMPITAEDLKDLGTLIRFANSLKLRLAMHIVKRDETKARQWAEEAVTGGVIETTGQQVGLFPKRSGFNNPITEMWNNWNDMRLGAGFESVLKSLNHPYKDLLFNKNELIVNSKDPSLNVPAGNRVVGIRTGAHVGNEQSSPSNPYNGFSKISEQYMLMSPLYMIKLSEVCFLRAEGAIRGWNMGGTAEEFYNRGILNSNLQDPEMKFVPGFDEAMDAYMQQTQATPFTYVDPTGDTESIVSPITIGVKWNEGDTQEVKLEKIITQKYIALFPNSIEAWVDLRRTGYPRLFDALNPGDGDGSLQPGDIIRRLPFADTQDAATLKDVLSTGMKALGDVDKQSTRLWWDVKKGNF